MKLDKPENFMNRELSWLKFNARVLEEGENQNNRILERVKFLSIVSSNLDEFYMVRVAILKRTIDVKAGKTGPDGIPPKTLLTRILHKTRALVKRQYDCLNNIIIPELAKEKIFLSSINELNSNELGEIQNWFREQLLPVITPLAIDNSHPFPLLASCAVYIMFKVIPDPKNRLAFGNETDTILIQVPSECSRFCQISLDNSGIKLIPVEEIISKFADEIFGGYKIKKSVSFRVTRDADITVDEEESDDLLSEIETKLRHRRRGAPVRLEVSDKADQKAIEYLRKKSELENDDVFLIPGLLSLKSLFEIIPINDNPKLVNEKLSPLQHPLLSEYEDMFEAMRNHDILLHHPYQSFQPVIDLVEHAASDPDVLAIKVTLYRVSGDSPIVKSLIKAAENGKQVTVLVELRARFDEEANINWAKILDKAGAHVIYGIAGYKVHAKSMLIVRQENDGIKRYVHLSTGNYNDKTARLYTDLGLLTCNMEIGADISSFFNVITGYSIPPKWNHIEIAPTGLRKKIIFLIEREIEKHAKETPGHIRIKINSLIDQEIIEYLYKASCKGVRIELIIRGLCRLRTGIKNLSENIKVISIVGQFLEHPRIYYFKNGGDEEIYLSSADLMERNLNKRIELFFPVLDQENQNYIKKIFDISFKDRTNAWELLPDNSYKRYENKNRKNTGSQKLFYDDLYAKILKDKVKSKQVFDVINKPRSHGGML